ncbi:monofunctional biosynthetic peptidoglycan transglycosylase [Penaeicola halotolerans]|uniref:monofunctional biosynthetic peptidoglycan transglycosylase n=1 Tax=Penaeicola halotolerans TaxID=2793196 RepID=UPI001CF821C5|nr:monofunctional biosynthetic peptidoglycan transglycosylase [Penaeicola halotolerans]
MSYISLLFRWVKKLTFAFFYITITYVVILRFVPPPATPLMLIRVVEQWSEDKELRLYKDWKSLDEISPNLVQAVVAAEDQKFMTHFGLDIEAMQKAYENNKKGRRLKGGSTISQQTAKNIFLWPGRSYLRKGLEAYFTVLIESLWGKKRIMEMYLNQIEMGNGVYGAEAAAQTYYLKPASKLSRAEAAMIAATLPNPRRWTPARPTDYIYGRQNWIMRNMSNIEKVEFK